jgi:CheY-like chemotaxis protein
MMPGVSGFEVLEKIRNCEDTRLKRVPVVMITARSLPDDIEKAIQLGATSYIVKPFRAEALIEKVFENLAPSRNSQF